MNFITEEIKMIQKEMTSLVMHVPEEVFSAKPDPFKWSNKETLGHLIDSAMHNLVRFTEAQYLPEPYQHRPYNQDELISINKYQNVDSEDLLVLWLSLNDRIRFVMDSATNAIRKKKVILTNGDETDLDFLMKDYVQHLNLHLKQLK